LVDLFSIKEVSAYLKVSQRLVRRMIATGELEAMKVGREWRVPIDSIAAWVDNNRE
jgi:excisionase family DNA binding protein